MATNGVTNNKGEDDGMIHVTDTGSHDNFGGNLSHVKTGMTISPELFEKVCLPFKLLSFMNFKALTSSGTALLDTKDCCSWRFQKAFCKSNTFGIDGVSPTFIDDWELEN